jgi:protein-S-isoprenylcysteine O-methyltransferase Ste14
VWLEFVLDLLFHGTMDAAASERLSKRSRILCLLLSSALFLTVLTCLFLAAFLPGDQSLLRRAGFLFLGLGILLSYVKFLKYAVRKGGKKP